MFFFICEIFCSYHFIFDDVVMIMQEDILFTNLTYGVPKHMVRQNQKDFVLVYPCDVNPTILEKIYHFVAIDQTKVLRYWEQVISCFMMKLDLDK